MNKSIAIKSIWEDSDLFEIKIKAFNGMFSGQADCYTTREEMEKLAKDLQGFPKSINDEYEFSTGPNENFSTFSLKFACINKSGHIVVEIRISEKIIYSNIPNVDNFAKFRMPIEAAGIDVFSGQIEYLSKSEIGKVVAELSIKI